MLYSAWISGGFAPESSADFASALDTHADNYIGLHLYFVTRTENASASCRIDRRAFVQQGRGEMPNRNPKRKASTKYIFLVHHVHTCGATSLT